MNPKPPRWRDRSRPINIRPVIGVLGVLAVAGSLSACSDDPTARIKDADPVPTAAETAAASVAPPPTEQAPPSLDPTAPIVPEAAVIAAGSEFNVTFSGAMATKRGAYFYLYPRGADAPVAVLVSNKADAASPKPSVVTDLATVQIKAVAVSGPGPDRFVAPSGVAPGNYDLCGAGTTTARVEPCATILLRPPG